MRQTIQLLSLAAWIEEIGDPILTEDGKKAMRKFLLKHKYPYWTEDNLNQLLHQVLVYNQPRLANAAIQRLHQILSEHGYAMPKQ